MSKQKAYVERLDNEAEQKYQATATTSIQAAADELNRELHARLRIYPRWVSNCTLSYTDAETQGARLETAVVLLLWLRDQMRDLASGKLTSAQVAANLELLKENL
jgi:L-rhamnose isomerase